MTATQTTNATACEIIFDAYRTSVRADIDFQIEPGIDSGTPVTILQDEESSLVLGDEWETDARGETRHAGYSWTTWSRSDPTDSWDEGGALTESEAREHVSEWLAR